MNRYLLPLGIFLVLVVFLGIGLGLNPREIPSPLIDKPAPAFELVQLHEPGKSLTTQDMQGKVWLLNVWASWCVSCREEHPVLVELAKTRVVPIVGLNYKDQRPEALRWLQQFGDPYVLSIVDGDGRVIAFGHRTTRIGSVWHGVGDADAVFGGAQRRRPWLSGRITSTGIFGRPDKGTFYLKNF